MIRAIAFTMAMVAFGIPVAQADPTLDLSVTTDKGIYAVGETVHWTIWASTSVGDTAGVALLSVSLLEAHQEELSPALTETISDPDDQLQFSDFSVAGKFLLASPGVADTDIDGNGFVADITVFQMPDDRLLNQCSDGVSHVFAKGSFTATTLGENTLSIDFAVANYWPDGTGNARAFALGNSTPALFTVIPAPAPLTITAGIDLAWVYQNTAVSTLSRHKSVLTVAITGGSLGGGTYAITVGQGGGALVDFSVPSAPVAIVPGTPQTVDVLGGPKTSSTAGSYTLNVTVTGSPGGQTATQDVALSLRKLGDINGDGAVTAEDKLEMNKKLNGLANLPGIGLRELDLTGDGATVTAEDKLIINQVLNGLTVP